MADLIRQGSNGYYPRPHDFVSGVSNGELYYGSVLPSFKDVSKPAVFSHLSFTACYCLCTDHKRRALTALNPIKFAYENGGGL